MKLSSVFLGIVFMAMVGVGTAQAQVPVSLLPDAHDCVGTGAPGPNEMTVFVSNNYNPLPYCQTIDLSTHNFGSFYHVDDLSVYGWAQNYWISSVIMGSSAYANLYTNVNLQGGYFVEIPNRKTSGLTSLHVMSIKAWHIN